MFETDRCKWIDYKLYYGNKDTGISVEEYPVEGYILDDLENNLWKIRFEGGDRSKDYYNLTRAKDNAVNLFIAEQNKKLHTTLEGASESGASTADALKPQQA